MTEQLKLALEGLTTLTKALAPTRRAVTNAINVLGSETSSLPRVQKVVSELEKAPESLRRAVPALDNAVQRAREALAQHQADRRDVIKRRDQLAAAAKAAGISHRFTDAADYLGPFRVEHSESEMVIRLGKTAIGRLKSPSGSEAVAFIVDAEAKLRKLAFEGWDEFVGALHRKQEEISTSEAVPWRALIEAAVPDRKARRRLAPALLYRLALLSSSEAPGGWKFAITPPTLAEQQFAIEVPDLRHPGEPIRVARGRLTRS